MTTLLPCDLCAKPQHYDLLCLSCCVRLVMSAPKHQRQSMLDVIARHKGSPSESEIRAEAMRVRERK